MLYYSHVRPQTARYHLLLRSELHLTCEVSSTGPCFKPAWYALLLLLRRHSCNVFTAKWQIVSAMVGVAQLLVMNIVAYFATNRFRTTTRVEASVILIFTTASSAFAPFACPLVLMILKKRAINKLQVIAFAWRFFSLSVKRCSNVVVPCTVVHSTRNTRMQ